jgi:hypothetical protein
MMDSALDLPVFDSILNLLIFGKIAALFSISPLSVICLPLSGKRPMVIEMFDRGGRQ